MNDFTKLEDITQIIESSKYTFYRLLTSNDVDHSNSHQSGYYIPFSAYFMIFGRWYFDIPIEKVNATILWGIDEIKTCSTFTYYSSKKEARLTCISKYKESFNKENIGALFVLAKEECGTYHAYILKEKEIEKFYKKYNIISGATNRLLDLKSKPFELCEDIYNQLNKKIIKFAKKNPILVDTKQMSSNAQQIFDYYAGKLNIRNNDDLLLLRWLFVEENLFYAIEYLLYFNQVKKGFNSVEEFLALAKRMTNSRKSRAGHSLENMLITCFDRNNIKYTVHGRTEGKEKVDFLFPSETAYQDTSYPNDKLISLESKMSLKERWKEAVHEAARIDVKHLFTLEPVNESKIQEMKRLNVQLVTASENIAKFPPRFQGDILDLRTFIQKVKEKQN